VPGVGLTDQLTDQIQLELGYVAIGATYIRSFNGIDTGTGSVLAGDPFDDDSDAITANFFGAEVAIDLTRKITLGGESDGFKRRLKI
jgi:hypothetical protein